MGEERAMQTVLETEFEIKKVAKLSQQEKQEVLMFLEENYREDYCSFFKEELNAEEFLEVNRKRLEVAHSEYILLAWGEGQLLAVAMSMIWDWQEVNSTETPQSQHKIHLLDFKIKKLMSKH